MALFFVPLAEAFVKGPILVATEVTPNEQASAVVEYGLCDALMPDAIDVVVFEDTIQVKVMGVRFSGLFCGVEPSVVRFLVGPFSPGDYRIDLTYEYVLLATGEVFSERIGSEAFSVVEARPIYALSGRGTITLVVLTVLLGLRRAWTRTQPIVL